MTVGIKRQLDRESTPWRLALDSGGHLEPMGLKGFAPQGVAAR